MSGVLIPFKVLNIAIVHRNRPGFPVPGLAILSCPGPGQVNFFGPGQIEIFDPGTGPGQSAKITGILTGTGLGI